MQSTYIILYLQGGPLLFLSVINGITTSISRITNPQLPTNIIRSFKYVITAFITGDGPPCRWLNFQVVNTTDAALDSLNTSFVAFLAGEVTRVKACSPASQEQNRFLKKSFRKEERRSKKPL